jgi:hypothetical protein
VFQDDQSLIGYNVVDSGILRIDLAKSGAPPTANDFDYSVKYPGFIGAKDAFSDG